MRYLFPTLFLARIDALSPYEPWTETQEEDLGRQWKNLISDNYLFSLSAFDQFNIDSLDIIASDKVAPVHEHTCETGFFMHSGKCKPQLTCGEIERQVVVEPKVLASGIGKHLSAATWTDENRVAERVAFVQTRKTLKESIQMRVKLGVQNLLDLGSSPHVQTVYGYCFEESTNTTMYIGEFCSNGNLAEFANSDEYATWSTSERVKFTISMVEAFHHLHNTPLGPRINCDMNRLHRGMTQFLVTQDYRVVLNDVDDIPLVSKNARCSRWAALDKDQPVPAHHFDFIAPEQVAKFGPPLTEKVDIWKIPDIVLHLLLKNPSSIEIKKQILSAIFTLKPTLEKCKEFNPSARPDTHEILMRLYEIEHSVERHGW